jgi:hypothetical protein
MTVTRTAAALFSVAALCATAAEKEAPIVKPPDATIANHHIKMRLFLPDPTVGYYRGARFDWSGIIERVEFGGHRVFAPFQLDWRPALHDHVAGPAEEFDMDDPQGYADAPVGGKFVKIGVGFLKRPDDRDYAFMRPYEIADGGQWDVEKGADRIEFRHTLGPKNDWGYVYTKRIVLAADGPGFAISHTLLNTGTKPIETVHYNHNFTIVDDDTIGPGYSVLFPFDVAAFNERGWDMVKVDGNRLDVTQAVTKGHIWAEFAAPKTVKENTFTVTHAKSGINMVVTGDRPLYRYRIFANSRALCPEPFIPVNVAPGKSAGWSTRYTFDVAGK